MKFSKLAVLGAALALATTFAKADSINGSLGVSGTDTWNGTAATATSVTFAPGALVSTTSSGSFAGLIGDAVTFVENPLFFVNPTGELFSVPPSLASFTIDTFSIISPSTSGIYVIEGVGTFTEAGESPDSMTGTYFFSTSLSGDASTFEFTGTALPPAATPEPSSLVLLGSGLVSAAGMIVRRRRVA